MKNFFLNIKKLFVVWRAGSKLHSINKSRWGNRIFRKGILFVFLAVYALLLQE